ncbi:MAG: hypothetical protein HY058_18970 [Proteobacteria bacterium]|nr:hypothetical protein [Pseudomonadota bacterium]
MPANFGTGTLGRSRQGIDERAHRLLPRASEIAVACALSESMTEMLISDLQEHDLLGLDETSGRISYADPFTASKTEHRVALQGHQLRALCAIDALGVGAMYDTDVTIES